jgi:hypothetical protein
MQTKEPETSARIEPGLESFGQQLLAFVKKTNNSLKYLLLLLSLETLAWSDVFYDGTAARPGGISWADLNVAITLLLAVFAVNRRKWVMAVAATLALLALGWSWGAAFLPTQAVYIASDLCSGLFFAFVAGVVWYDIGQTEGVTTDTLIGSVCAYALIAATWAFAYSLTDLLAPGSFQFPTSAGSGAQTAPHPDYSSFLYYSFITICSVGYGDVVPLKPAARMLATGEAVIGQFYMAILVARLVSLHLEQARRKNSAPQPAGTAAPKEE